MRIELPTAVKDYEELMSEFDRIRPNDFILHPELDYMREVLSKLHKR